MNWLIDTNVISEIGKNRPNRNVVEWFSNVRQEALLISIISIVEIRFGVESLNDDAKKAQLATWLEDIVRPMFLTRILGLSEDILVTWRALALEAKKLNQTIPQADALIAATAKQGGFKVCTRDVSPYLVCNLPVLNPFTGERYNGA